MRALPPNAAPTEAAVQVRAQGTATAEGLQQARQLGMLSQLARNATGSTTYALALAFRRGCARNPGDHQLAGPVPRTAGSAGQDGRYRAARAFRDPTCARVLGRRSCGRGTAAAARADHARLGHPGIGPLPARNARNPDPRAARRHWHRVDRQRNRAAARRGSGSEHQRHTDRCGRLGKSARPGHGHRRNGPHRQPHSRRRLVSPAGPRTTCPPPSLCARRR